MIAQKLLPFYDKYGFLNTTSSKPTILTLQIHCTNWHKDTCFDKPFARLFEFSTFYFILHTYSHKWLFFFPLGGYNQVMNTDISCFLCTPTSNKSSHVYLPPLSFYLIVLPRLQVLLFPLYYFLQFLKNVLKCSQAITIAIFSFFSVRIFNLTSLLVDVIFKVTNFLNQKIRTPSSSL